MINTSRIAALVDALFGYNDVGVGGDGETVQTPCSPHAQTHFRALLGILPTHWDVGIGFKSSRSYSGIAHCENSRKILVEFAALLQSYAVEIDRAVIEARAGDPTK